MKREHDEEEINRTMNSLDNLQKAEAPPFLYTKVKARLGSKRERQLPAFLSMFTKPAISFAALLLTVVVNVYALKTFTSGKEQVDSRQDAPMVSFAKEYGLMSYSAYDKTN